MTDKRNVIEFKIPPKKKGKGEPEAPAPKIFVTELEVAESLWNRVLKPNRDELLNLRFSGEAVVLATIWEAYSLCKQCHQETDQPALTPKELMNWAIDELEQHFNPPAQAPAE